MTGETVAHDSFTLERKLDAPVARVFAAFASEAGKARWFLGPPGWTMLERVFDSASGGASA